MKNTKSSMIDMMRKDAIELVIVELDKSETYPTGNGQESEQYGNKNRRANCFIWSKNTHGLDQIVEDPSTTLLLARLLHKLMHIPEYTQAPLE